MNSTSSRASHQASNQVRCPCASLAQLTVVNIFCRCDQIFLRGAAQLTSARVWLHRPTESRDCLVQCAPRRRWAAVFLRTPAEHFPRYHHLLTLAINTSTHLLQTSTSHYTVSGTLVAVFKICCCLLSAHCYCLDLASFTLTLIHAIFCPCLNISNNFCCA